LLAKLAYSHERHQKPPVNSGRSGQEHYPLVQESLDKPSYILIQRELESDSESPSNTYNIYMSVSVQRELDLNNITYTNQFLPFQLFSHMPLSLLYT
jgi:hypothetical protein